MDNRNLDKSKDEQNLKEIVEDGAPIAEDVDPADHQGKVPDGDIDPHMPEPKNDPEPEPEPTPEPTSEPSKDDPDYEEKYKQSSREATNLYFKNKSMKDTVDKASALPDPSLDEMRAYAQSQGAVYDDLDTFSQNILKKTFISDRRFEMIKETTDAGRELDVWADKVDDFTSAPETLAKYPSMADHEVAFKKYCMKEARRGMEMGDLVASFLFHADKDAPAPKKKGKKKSMLLKGGGTKDSVAKPKQLTAEEVRVIRDKDPRRYARLVKEDKIGLDLLDRE